MNTFAPTFAVMCEPAEGGEGRDEVPHGEFVEEWVVVNVEHPLLEHLQGAQIVISRMSNARLL